MSGVLPSGRNLRRGISPPALSTHVYRARGGRKRRSHHHHLVARAKAGWQVTTAAPACSPREVVKITDKEIRRFRRSDTPLISEHAPHVNGDTCPLIRCPRSCSFLFCDPFDHFSRYEFDVSCWGLGYNAREVREKEFGILVFWYLNIS